MPQISQQHPSRICFITPGWHVTRDLNLLFFTMLIKENSIPQFIFFDNGNVRQFIREIKQTIMILKPNQLQVTKNHPQANAIIERVHKVVYCQWHAQIIWLGKQSWKYRITTRITHLITSFNQLHGYQAIRSTYHTALQATPCQLVFGRDMMDNTWIEYKKENRTL
jgi:hypothetical protein